MRFKEFIIFIIVFTIIYVLFFIVYDKLSDTLSKKKLIKKANDSISIENYNNFALFYGFYTKLSLDSLINIFTIINNSEQINEINLLDVANQHGTTPYEIAVCVCYFEYLGLIKRRTILLNTNSMIENSFKDQNIISKYFTVIQNKSSFEDIKKVFGEETRNDFTNINDKFLFPGVRFNDNVIYYYGGDTNA